MSVMAARGFVTREADPSHGRIILLKLTDEGAAMLRECEAVLRPLETRMLGDVSADTAADAARARTVLAQPARLTASRFHDTPAGPRSLRPRHRRPPDRSLISRRFLRFPLWFTPALAPLAISGSLILNEAVRSRNAAHRIAHRNERQEPI